MEEELAVVDVGDVVLDRRELAVADPEGRDGAHVHRLAVEELLGHVDLEQTGVAVDVEHDELVVHRGRTADQPRDVPDLEVPTVLDRRGPEAALLDVGDDGVHVALADLDARVHEARELLDLLVRVGPVLQAEEQLAALELHEADHVDRVVGERGGVRVGREDEHVVVVDLAIEREAVRLHAGEPGDGRAVHVDLDAHALGRVLARLHGGEEDGERNGGDTVHWRCLLRRLGRDGRERVACQADRRTSKFSILACCTFS